MNTIEPATTTRPLDGPALLDTVHSALTRHMPALTDHQADALTLWVAATHVPHVWNHTPLLVITGPHAAGKTRLLYALADLSDYSMITDAPAPNLRRTLAHWPTTVFVDDVTERLLSRDSRTMRMLRECTRRRGSGELFVMAALATHADPPAALADKALVIRLPASATRPGPARGPRGLFSLAHELRAWLAVPVDEFPPPSAPDTFTARQVPFLPLLDVADHAGRDWPDRGRRATAALTDAAR